MRLEVNIFAGGETYANVVPTDGSTLDTYLDVLLFQYSLGKMKGWKYRVTDDEGRPVSATWEEDWRFA